jgi:hypothetical protein
MEYDFASYHEPLLKSEHALKLGQIHCAILVADNAYEKRARVQKTEKDGEFDLSPVELTLFGEETLSHFIKWWVRKKVGQIRVFLYLPENPDLFKLLNCWYCPLLMLDYNYSFL